MRAVLLALCLAAPTAACGIGLYDDTGSPEPGQWWPWVCADGGEPDGEGGCEPAAPASDARAHDACADGGADGPCE